MLRKDNISQSLPFVSCASCLVSEIRATVRDRLHTARRVVCIGVGPWSAHRSVPKNGSYHFSSILATKNSSGTLPRALPQTTSTGTPPNHFPGHSPKPLPRALPQTTSPGTPPNHSPQIPEKRSEYDRVHVVLEQMYHWQAYSDYPQLCCKLVQTQKSEKILGHIPPEGPAQ